MGREIKRVAKDFEWPIDSTIWKGYHNPYHGLKCEECGGSGYSPEAKQLSDSWYSHLSPTGEGWGRHLIQEDVQALIDGDRLWDFTRVPRNEEQRRIVEEKVAGGGNSWLPESNGYIPTAAEVNAWSRRGMGHDSINQWICVKARCERDGITIGCKWCSGKGEIWPDDKYRELAEKWEGIEPPSGDGWQLWNTVTEGHPMSPVFGSPEELAKYLADNGVSAGGYDTLTYDQWLHWITQHGWAPSMVMDSRGLRSGVLM